MCPRPPRPIQRGRRSPTLPLDVLSSASGTSSPGPTPPPCSCRDTDLLLPPPKASAGLQWRRRALPPANPVQQSHGRVLVCLPRASGLPTEKPLISTGFQVPLSKHIETRPPRPSGFSRSLVCKKEIKIEIEIRVKKRKRTVQGPAHATDKRVKGQRREPIRPQRPLRPPQPHARASAERQQVAQECPTRGTRLGPGPTRASRPPHTTRAQAGGLRGSPRPRVPRRGTRYRPQTRLP
ncbi:hypothetical protein C8Q78DRAFT_505462 [Trametes maxima]|nr:hypothetical protein C8Q78DRAFT_505462 [Trametes maxima]